MPKAVKGHYAAQLQNDFVTYGGYYRYYNPYVQDTVEVYDPYAFGASVDVPQGALYIGGRCAPAVSRMFLLRKDVPRVKTNMMWKIDASGQERHTLLPCDLWRQVATYLDGNIYVAGGLHDSISGNDELLSITWPDSKAWKKISKIPQSPLVSPLLITCGDDLLLLGGCTQATDTLAYDTWQKRAWKYKISKDEWQEISVEEVPDSLFPAAGGMSVSVGRFTTAFFGGQERDGHYRQHIVLYNRLLNSWSAIPGDSLLARVDAVVTKSGDGWIVSGGQVTQGVNTTDVTYVYFADDFLLYYSILFVLALVAICTFLVFRKK